MGVETRADLGPEYHNMDVSDSDLSGEEGDLQQTKGVPLFAGLQRKQLAAMAKIYPLSGFQGSGDPGFMLQLEMVKAMRELRRPRRREESGSSDDDHMGRSHGVGGGIRGLHRLRKKFR